jgi:carbonic anhydrase/acetyltransferase-like protein (isoleucine patch superfamily)
VLNCFETRASGRREVALARWKEHQGETLIRSYRGRWPQIAASAYIDPAAVIIGDVTIGEHASVWPGVVIRGDVHWIRIGARSNIQDGSVLHVMKDQYPLIIDEGVTVGHGVILHGCTIESRVLVGMGSILLNNVRVGTGSIIAAGTLVPEGTTVAPSSLFMGHPGKLRRTLAPQDLESIDAYAARYIEYAQTYRDEASASRAGEASAPEKPAAGRAPRNRAPKS